VGEQAIAQMSLPTDARVLDVGCGSGWASRLIAARVPKGHVVGIDISDEMVQLAKNSSTAFPNVEFKVASAEALPFSENEFKAAFSMESIYYYSNMLAALREIHRVLQQGGEFVSVIDLYLENRPSHQWVESLKVPVQLLGIREYRWLLTEAGFINLKDARLIDPTPVPENYSGSSFKSREDYVEYKENGSLLLIAEARK